MAFEKARKFFKNKWLWFSVLLIGIIFLLSTSSPQSMFTTLNPALANSCQVLTRTNANSLQEYNNQGTWIAINDGISDNLIGYDRKSATSSTCFPTLKIFDLPYGTYAYVKTGKTWVCVNGQSRQYIPSNNPNIERSKTPVAEYSTRETTNGLCGGAGCQERWECTSWGSCQGNSQTRECSDLNYCGTTGNMPSEEQACLSDCTPNWEHGDWSSCSAGRERRSFVDLNNCGIPLPAEYETERVCCTPDWRVGEWSQCIDGQQVRSCKDNNNCDVGECPSDKTKACTVEGKEPFDVCKYFDWAPKLTENLDECTSGIIIVGVGVGAAFAFGG